MLFISQGPTKVVPAFPPISLTSFHIANESCLNAIQLPLPSYIRFHVSCLMMEDLGILVLRVFVFFFMILTIRYTACIRSHRLMMFRLAGFCLSRPFLSSTSPPHQRLIWILYWYNSVIWSDVFFTFMRVIKIPSSESDEASVLVASEEVCCARECCLVDVYFGIAP